MVSGAPLWLTVSGISDILAKYISLADWKIAHLVSGEYYCPMVADLAEEALTIMRKLPMIWRPAASRTLRP